MTCFADLDWMVRQVALEASEQLLDNSLMSVLAVLDVLRNICQVMRDTSQGDSRNGRHPRPETVKVEGSVSVLKCRVSCCW